MSKLVPARTLERDGCCPDEGGYEWTSKTVKVRVRYTLVRGRGPWSKIVGWYLTYKTWARHLHYTHNLKGDPPPRAEKKKKVIAVLAHKNEDAPWGLQLD